MLALRLMSCAIVFIEEAIISLGARIRSSRLRLRCAIRFYLSRSPDKLDGLRVINDRLALTASLLMLTGSVDKL